MLITQKMIQMIIKRAAISHSKYRNEFGIVGIEANSDIKKIRVKLARQWPRTQISTIPDRIASLYTKVQWGETYVDQLTGEHFIQDLKRQHKMLIRVINTNKNLKEPDEIERVKTMDKIEMVQWMVTVKQNHQIEFPEKPTSFMKELEAQMALFTEHKTESGNIDYFAPGDEFDNLTKALMIACFSVRKLIDVGADTKHIMGGIHNRPSMSNMLNLQDFKSDKDVTEMISRSY